MSDTCIGVGCRDAGAHLNILAIGAEQRREARKRELAELDDRMLFAPLGDPEEAPFTTDGTPDESPRYIWVDEANPPAPDLAWYQDMEVEVVDPTGVERLIDRIFNPTFEDTVDAVLAEARDLIVDRQRTYGPSNIEQQGVFGVVNRITFDKAARVRNRLNGKIVNGEIVLDDIPLGTVDEPGIVNDAFDFIGYATCLILLLRGEWGKPLAGDE